MLEADQLSVAISGKTILSDISLRLAPGTLTAIVGPSGSGKSTLLRALTGEIGYGGTARLNGCEVRTTSPEKLAAMRAVLPQETQVAFAFTAGEVIALGAYQGPPPSRARIEELLAIVGLGGMGNRLVQSLSGGERQRIHLARVLLQAGEPVGPDGPRWLFLDEPVSSLDIAHQISVMRIARAYADRGGAVVAVMHDLNLSAMFADRLAVLHQGRFVTEGTPSEVLDTDLIARVYGCRIPICTAPQAGPWILVQAAL